MDWVVASSSFLASAVEVVEAFTVVLVVGVTINWRSALVGAAIAVAILAALVAIFGVELVPLIPINVLRLVVGVLLVLFGLKWLKKAIMRYSGLKALNSEEERFERNRAELRARGEAVPQEIDKFGAITAFKSVLLEGFEVVFIVITIGTTANADHLFGTNSGSIGSASIGATAAFLVVMGVGAVIRVPLQHVPENTLKFIVGVMLVSFGTFWGGEGLGISWWQSDLSLLFLIIGYVITSFVLIQWLKQAGGDKIASSRGKFTPRTVAATDGQVVSVQKEKLSR